MLLVACGCIFMWDVPASKHHPTSVLMHCLHSCLDASIDDYDEYIHSLCLFLAVRDDNVVCRICSNWCRATSTIACIYYSLILLVFVFVEDAACGVWMHFYVRCARFRTIQQVCWCTACTAVWMHPLMITMNIFIPCAFSWRWETITSSVVYVQIDVERRSICRSSHDMRSVLLTLPDGESIHTTSETDSVCCYEYTSLADARASRCAEEFPQSAIYQGTITT